MLNVTEVNDHLLCKSKIIPVLLLVLSWRQFVSSRESGLTVTTHEKGPADRAVSGLHSLVDSENYHRL